MIFKKTSGEEEEEERREKKEERNHDSEKKYVFVRNQVFEWFYAKIMKDFIT